MKEHFNERQEKALEKVDFEYNDIQSPHYRDNQRYKSSTGIINDNFYCGDYESDKYKCDQQCPSCADNT